MKFSIMGCCYAGLVIGTCLADLGNEVICWDNNIEKIRKLKKGITSVHEPGLSEKILNNIENKSLRFTSSIRDSVKKSDVIFISVDTLINYDGSVDLKLILSLADGIGKYMNGYKVVVNISAVPVGTGEEIRKIIKGEIDERNIDIDFDVVSNPGFLREGTAINDFMHPDMVVIGYDNERAGSLIKRVYEQVVEPGKILSTSIRSAEMIKYALNTMLAAKISFINDISNLCEILGSDIEAVRQGMEIERTLGNSFYSPGIGYGDSYFADVKVLINEAKKHAYNMTLLKAVGK